MLIYFDQGKHVNRTLFGTDGIRGKVGNDPFTQEKLMKIGYGIGKWIYQRYGPHATTLIISDTRISCSFVKAALKSGLLLHPLNLYDAGILPSPATLHIMQQNHNIKFGIIISASHNSYYDNGIKLLDSQTGKLTEKDELKISSLIDDEPKFYSYNHLGNEYINTKLRNEYIEKIVSYFKSNFLQKRQIFLDCAHGSTYQVAPHIFKALGAHVKMISCRPTGFNINKKCGSTFPERLQLAINRHHADAGFAFDGDGDRVIAINKHGQIKDGDDILALMTMHPDYQNEQTLVGTIMSNKGLDFFLSQSQKKLFRTNVGDKFIAQYLEKNNLHLGGEPSGHIIFNNYLPTGDGIFTALKCLETMQLTNNWEIKTFTKLPQIIINIPVRVQKELANNYLAQLIKESENKLANGRLVVRYSGTENKLRIMAEHYDKNYAHLICTQLAENLLKEVS